MTNSTRRRLTVSLSLAGGLAALNAPIRSHAQTFPSRPIRIVVPFAPGGTSEIVARSVAIEMGNFLKQNVFVENKPGGAGVIAMNDVLKSPADGHTLVISHVGTFAVNPFAMAKQPYDVNKDFTSVALLSKVPNLFVVHPDLPARNLKEFVALAKAKPGFINYGSAGNASAGHLAFEYLQFATGMRLTHIPYRGTGPQLVDLVAGLTQAASAGAPALLPYIRDGRVRAIAVGMLRRIPALPDVPTVAEQGYPGFETSQWYGLSVPSGTPRPIIERLNAAANHALRSKTVGEKFTADNAVFTAGSPEDYTKFIAEEQARWANVVKQSGLKID